MVFVESPSLVLLLIFISILRSFSHVLNLAGRTQWLGLREGHGDLGCLSCITGVAQVLISGVETVDILGLLTENEDDL